MAAMTGEMTIGTTGDTTGTTTTATSGMETGTMARRARGLLLVTALGVGGAFGLHATAARACGMIEYGGESLRRMPPRRSEPLLLAATTAANQGRLSRARALALRVALSGAPEVVRARAWAIAGWASWRQGARGNALRSFARARRLDPGATAIDRVLAQVAPAESVADLKKVLPG